MAGVAHPRFKPARPHFRVTRSTRKKPRWRVDSAISPKRLKRLGGLLRGQGTYDLRGQRAHAQEDTPDASLTSANLVRIDVGGDSGREGAVAAREAAVASPPSEVLCAAERSLSPSDHHDPCLPSREPFGAVPGRAGTVARWHDFSTDGAAQQRQVGTKGGATRSCRPRIARGQGAAASRSSNARRFGGIRDAFGRRVPFVCRPPQARQLPNTLTLRLRTLKLRVGCAPYRLRHRPGWDVGRYRELLCDFRRRTHLTPGSVRRTVRASQRCRSRGGGGLARRLGRYDQWAGCNGRRLCPCRLPRRVG